MAADSVLAAAVDVARTAAEEVAEQPGFVGDHLGMIDEGDKVLTHRFSSLAPGYAGWEWTVTLARVPRARTATVSEVGLIAGETSVVAPPWVPWADRLQPGDMRPGDVLPYVEHDDRLEFGYEATGEVGEADEVAIWEMGLGRERVLSRKGRDEAATRWYRGSRGPTAPSAIASDKPCSTCGFLVLMAGALRTEFGVCANEWSPDDGKVVSMDHGCGAHSQTDIAPAPPTAPRGAVYDNVDIEIIETSAEKLADAGFDEPPVADAEAEAESGEAAEGDKAATHDEALAADDEALAADTEAEAESGEAAEPSEHDDETAGAESADAESTEGDQPADTDSADTETTPSNGEGDASGDS